MTSEHVSHAGLTAQVFDGIANEYALGQATRLDVARVPELVAATQEDVALDVATGTGALATALAPAVRCVIAADISDGMLDVAKERAAGLRSPVFLNASAESLPFADRQFQIVTCSRALHHMVDPAAAINEMARVLEFGGRLLIVDNITYEEGELARKHNELERLRDPSHAQTLTLTALERMIGDAACTVKSTDVTSSTRPLAQWLADAGRPFETSEPAVEFVDRGLSSDDDFFARHVSVDEQGEKILSHRTAWILAERTTEEPFNG
ncbi:MAG: class I SAM-dependent methyltransferase [Solirubrobacterales bacterium]